MRRFASLLMGLVMALALAAPAMAQTVTSTQVNVNVAAVITVTGIPASLDFGSGFPDETLPDQSFNVTVAGNSAWTFTFHMVNDLNGSPSGTIARANVKVNGDAASATPQNVYRADQQASTFPVAVGLRIPPNTPAGAYTAAITWTCSPV